MVVTVLRWLIGENFLVHLDNLQLECPRRIRRFLIRDTFVSVSFFLLELIAFVNCVCKLQYLIAKLIADYLCGTYRAVLGKLEPPKTLMKSLEPVQRNCLSKFQQGLDTQRTFWQKFCFSGKRLRIGSILGVSAVFGSYSCWPHLVYAMDGHDFLVHDHYGEPLDASDVEEDSRALWRFARKFWMPVFFFLTVLTHLSDPVSIIALKVVLFLLCTKPSPFSVYVSVDELCHQSMLREPFFYKPKSMYAKKIEIEDYKLLCLARVEVGDQKFTLIGILGGWWTLPSLPSREAFSLLRLKTLNHK